ncbi:hypothetical protein [Tsukamurella paurometabola]|uniref:Uncharacterized protein n=1 Tax=Tsukamurella paurometabola TaxID=2061 RepID=A0ABS5NIQ8_TSUPA|nr:hypothetical protein [Tsukamurella paurometabola]MBS4104143.1 hypothetical protein [Tsukamurella paurometabola]
MAAHARGNPVHASGSAGDAGGSVAQQRLQGAFLTVIGLAGMFGGVMFSIEAPRFTPVPVVFLTFWLIMVIVGRIFFTGLSKLRSAGVGAPAPEQVRAAAAVAGIVVAVGMMGFAATGPGAGVASAAPCPGGGPATCGPGPGPELTITPPAQQTTAPGGQQGSQGSGQDNNGIATSPAGSGGNDGGNIQAQTPDFGSPGGQAPNIPGNPTGQGQQPGQGQQTGQQNPVRTTAPGRPDQTGQQQTGQPTQSGQPSQSTVTVTQTQSQCPAPGAAGNGGAPGGGNGGPGAPGTEGGSGPDGDGENKDGAPSWSYLVAEATGVMAGRRRNTSGGSKPTADQAWKLWDQAQPGGSAGRSPEEMARMAGLKLNPDGTSADPSYDIITVPKEDGDYQKLILMKNQDAPKQYRFPLNTPEGGRSVKNDDGSISVFDRNGEQVGQFNAPWAYDANGKEVPTWYDIEGDEMVQHIEPGPDNVYPIIADPLWDSIKDKAKSVGNGVKNFGAGVGRGVADTVGDVKDMVTDPGSVVDGVKPLVGMGGEGAPGVAESWKQFGKSAVNWDDYARGDYAYATGKLIPSLVGGKGFTKLGKVLPDGDKPKPDTPETPDTPDAPKTPDTPDTPATPDVDVPKTPDIDTPATPNVDVPKTPDTPSTSTGGGGGSGPGEPPNTPTGGGRGPDGPGDGKPPLTSPVTGKPLDPTNPADFTNINNFLTPEQLQTMVGKDFWRRTVEPGNVFDRMMSGRYPLNQLHIVNPAGGSQLRLDSYVPGQAIISRKLTQFAEIQASTAREYINQFLRSYPAGAEIGNSTQAAASNMVGKFLQGEQILQVPPQAAAIPAEIAEYAASRGVYIVDIAGNVLNQNFLPMLSDAVKAVL